LPLARRSEHRPAHLSGRAVLAAARMKHGQYGAEARAFTAAINTLLRGAPNQAARSRGRRAAAASGPKPSFPASELEQTAAVLSVLTSVTAPVSPTVLAVRFRQGRHVLPQVEAVLAALVRVGGLVHSPDGGRSFLPRRVA
jgi:hypothetical protein